MILERIEPPLASHSLLKGAVLDIVTFGTPVRYGWDPSGIGKLLHIVNHRNLRTDGKAWLSKMELPQITMEMPIAWGGDYVQELAVAGTDAVPASESARAANKAVWELVEPYDGFERWVECARRAVRCPSEGSCLLSTIRIVPVRRMRAITTTVTPPIPAWMRCYSTTPRSSDVCTPSIIHEDFSCNCRHDDQCLPLSSSLCDPRAVSEDAFADHLRLDSHATPGRLNPSRSILVIVGRISHRPVGLTPPSFALLLRRRLVHECSHRNGSHRRLSDPAVCRRIRALPQTNRDLLGPGRQLHHHGNRTGRVASAVFGGRLHRTLGDLSHRPLGHRRFPHGRSGGCNLASNIQFMESATKSTPDMLQCLFLTSASGAPSRSYFSSAASRIGMHCSMWAPASPSRLKGMLAVMLMLFLWAFGRFRPMSDRSSIPLTHLGWLAAGLLIPLSWFVIRRFCKAARRFLHCLKIRSAIDLKALLRSSSRIWLCTC